MAAAPLSRIKTGGNFHHTAPDFTYFLAADMKAVRDACMDHNAVLIAVNEIHTDTQIDEVRRWCDQGKRVLIDSGIFNLASEHARKHELDINIVLGMQPEEVNGFPKLLDRYLSLLRRIGNEVWGYIELDLGGRETKKRTRAMLEREGLHPMPVYHPRVDGWAYFDELATGYDRFCFGNVAVADSETRIRLLATAWERHRQYPDLWIHLLGMTPNHWMYAMPINSGDSSGWLSAVKWGGYRELAAGVSMGHLHQNYRYRYGADQTAPDGRIKANRMSAYGAAIAQRNWINALRRWEAIGATIYPPPSPPQEGASR